MTTAKKEGHGPMSKRRAEKPADAPEDTWKLACEIAHAWIPGESFPWTAALDIEKRLRAIKAGYGQSRLLAGLPVSDKATVELLDLAEAAWGVIANVSGGDWSRQKDEWVEAAQRWRARYHAALEGAKR